MNYQTNTENLKLLVPLLLITLLLPSSVISQNYLGLWNRGGEQKIWADAEWSSFALKNNELIKDGYYLNDIEIGVVKGVRRFSGIWKQQNVPNKIEVNVSWSTLAARWRENLDLGYRMLDLEIYQSGSETRYIGIWSPQTAEQKILTDVAWADFRSKWEEFADDGFRLMDIEVYRRNGTYNYAGVWQEGGGNYRLQVDLTEADLRNAQIRSQEEKLSIVDIECYIKNGATYYTAVWRDGRQEEKLVQAPWNRFLTEIQNMEDNGMTLSDIEIEGVQRVLTVSSPISSPIVSTPPPSRPTPDVVPVSKTNDVIGSDKLENPQSIDPPAAEDKTTDFLVQIDDGDNIVGKEIKEPSKPNIFRRMLPGISTPDEEILGEGLDRNDVATNNNQPSAEETPPAEEEEPPAPEEPEIKTTGKPEFGKASYYADKFQGRPTASGEPFDQNQYTAAHKTLKFGTRIRVTNTANNKSVIVRVNDRGPFTPGRIVDLSRVASNEIGGVQAGIIDVKLEVLKD